jgi:hypothetical protein
MVGQTTVSELERLAGSGMDPTEFGGRNTNVGVKEWH